MQSRLSIKQKLSTYKHADFLGIEIKCRHPYYKDAAKPELKFVLSNHSRYILRKYNLLFKEEGSKLRIGQIQNKKDSSSNPGDLPNTTIRIGLEVTSPRFWMVTDLQQTFNTNKEFAENMPPFSKPNNRFIFTYDSAIENLSISSIIPLEKDFSKQNEHPSHAEELEFEKLVDIFNSYQTSKLLGVLVLDLPYILQGNNLTFKLKAAKAILRFIINKAQKMRGGNKKNGLKLEHFFDRDIEIKESLPMSGDQPILLSSKDKELFQLESEETWELKENNPHQNPNFFKFEAEPREDKSKAKQRKVEINRPAGNAFSHLTDKKSEIYLPFPKNLEPKQLKKKGVHFVIEQKVGLLRYTKK